MSAYKYYYWSRSTSLRPPQLNVIRMCNHPQIHSLWDTCFAIINASRGHILSLNKPQSPTTKPSCVQFLRLLQATSKLECTLSCSSCSQPTSWSWPTGRLCTRGPPWLCSLRCALPDMSAEQNSPLRSVMLTPLSLSGQAGCWPGAAVHSPSPLWPVWPQLHVWVWLLQTPDQWQTRWGGGRLCRCSVDLFENPQVGPTHGSLGYNWLVSWRFCVPNVWLPRQHEKYSFTFTHVYTPTHNSVTCTFQFSHTHWRAEWNRHCPQIGIMASIWIPSRPWRFCWDLKGIRWLEEGGGELIGGGVWVLVCSKPMTSFASVLSIIWMVLELLSYQLFSKPLLCNCPNKCHPLMQNWLMKCIASDSRNPLHTLYTYTHANKFNHATYIHNYSSAHVICGLYCAYIYVYHCAL